MIRILISVLALSALYSNIQAVAPAHTSNSTSSFLYEEEDNRNSPHWAQMLHAIRNGNFRNALDAYDELRRPQQVPIIHTNQLQILEALFVPLEETPRLTNQQQVDILMWILNRQIVDVNLLAAQIFEYGLNNPTEPRLLEAVFIYNTNIDLDNIRIQTDMPLLHVYASCLMKAHLQKAIPHYANPNQLDSAGNTAIHALLYALNSTPPHEAQYTLVIEILENLLQAGVDPSHRNQAGLNIEQLLNRLTNIPDNLLLQLQDRLKEYTQELEHRLLTNNTQADNNPLSNTLHQRHLMRITHRTLRGYIDDSGPIR